MKQEDYQQKTNFRKNYFVSAISYLDCFYSLGYIKTLLQEKKDALFSMDGVVIKKIIPL